MAYTLAPLINGKTYEHADIVMNIFGTPFRSIQAINYEYGQDMQNIYGSGNGVIGRGYGNMQPKADITMLMDEVEAIQAIAPGGVLQRIPEFDITVFYVDAAVVPRTHTIKNCRFTKNSRSVKQGDTSIAVQLDLIISHVEFV
jgi:hypothetical protein